MGMSSSQARLLALTGRMHDIEYKAQRIQAQKLQLANDSDRVYDDYLEALDKQKVMAKILNGDGSLTNTPLTSNLIYTYGNLSDQFVLTTKTGKALMPTSSHGAYKEADTLFDYLTTLGLTDTFIQTIHHSETNPNYTDGITSYNNDHSQWVTDTEARNTYEQEFADYENLKASWDEYHGYLDEKAAHDNWDKKDSDYRKYTTELTEYEKEANNWKIYNDYLNELSEWNRKNAAWQTYKQEQEAYNVWLQKYNEYESDPAVIKYREEYAAWEAENPDNTVKYDTTQEWWIEGEFDEGMKADFIAATKSGSSDGGCYGAAHDWGNIGCYKHVLSHLIDYNGSSSGTNSPYRTTLGGNVSYIESPGGYCDGNRIIDHNGNYTTSNEIFLNVSRLVGAGFPVHINEDESFDLNNESTDYDKLLSKFDYRTGEAKGLKQWLVDLYYICNKQNNVAGYPGTYVFAPTIEKIQDAIAGSFPKLDEQSYNEVLNEWKSKEPENKTTLPPPGNKPPVTWAPEPGNKPVLSISEDDVPASEPIPPEEVEPPGDEPPEPTPVNKPDKEAIEPTFVPEPGNEPILENYLSGINPTNEWDTTVTHNIVTDKNLAQWHINLWTKMQGKNEPHIVQTQIIYDDRLKDDVKIYTVADETKVPSTYSTEKISGATENENYIVINDSKLDDNNWITNAIENGVVIIQEFNKLANVFEDTSVQTNTRFEYIQDETNLKKAEAQYEADMKRIDRKDAKYDTDLAALDTERNAIKQEMETLKTVAKENVERTFKLFS